MAKARRYSLPLSLQKFILETMGSNKDVPIHFCMFLYLCDS